MTLSVAIHKHLGAFQLEASFETNGGVTALFGRSGSGKTSLLRQIAGLAKPDAGTIRFQNRVIVDVQSGRNIAAHKRRFGFVFQDARLFPHLTVQQNLDYGRFFAGSRTSGPDAGRVIEILGLQDLLTRKPEHLSGGEKQRVAIGRALLSNPDLLLLDEPLASLDDARKQEILPLLEQMRDQLKIPMIYVSHSVQEVARLANTVVVMKDGKVESVGAVNDVFNQPAFYDAAARNESGSLLEAVAAGYEPTHGLNRLSLPAGTLYVAGPQLQVGQKVRVQIPSRDVMISTQRPIGISALNVLEGTISSLRPGAENTVTILVDCQGDVISARLTTFSVERLDLKPGQSVFVVIKTVALDNKP